MIVFSDTGNPKNYSWTSNLKVELLLGEVGIFTSRSYQRQKNNQFHLLYLIYVIADIKQDALLKR